MEGLADHFFTNSSPHPGEPKHYGFAQPLAVFEPRALGKMIGVLPSVHDFPYDKGRICGEAAFIWHPVRSIHSEGLPFQVG